MPLSQLVVTFAGLITLAQQTYLLNARSYTLTGGQRLFPRVLSAQLHNPPGTPLDLLNRRILLQLNQTGDFSIYTLSVSGADIDPFFASHKLRFRLGCDDPFDCRPPEVPAPTEPELQVVIDYLAKDYSSFRQALLDFIPDADARLDRAQRGRHRHDAARAVCRHRRHAQLHAGPRRQRSVPRERDPAPVSRRPPRADRLRRWTKARRRTRGSSFG